MTHAITQLVFKDLFYCMYRCNLARCMAGRPSLDTRVYRNTAPVQWMRHDPTLGMVSDCHSFHSTLHSLHHYHIPDLPVSNSSPTQGCLVDSAMTMKSSDSKIAGATKATRCVVYIYTARSKKTYTQIQQPHITR
ncbi:hypothetical protein GDO78_009424 [Eleutherodactylus coqui]|uniref:Uncharacterized protein n=1 Tax=Eleutherodactylus coqui TaxID=57060 RepID=A0A8J6K7D7_ELECQ|nr:hypothetical protein GDO78_009424 [Eleutherodactylus coqui]